MSDETGRERAAALREAGGGMESRPVAVFRYAGRSEYGTRPGTMTPHADDAERKAALRARGWRIMNHRPLGELQQGDKMDADTVADLVDRSTRDGDGSAARTLVLDFLDHADPTDLHYWGSIDSDDLAALREADPVEYFRRLACTVVVARKAGGGGGVHVLDHTGGPHADRPEVRAWRAMFEAYGLATLPEPLGGGQRVSWAPDNWRLAPHGVCLERWYFDRLCGGDLPAGGAGVAGVGGVVRWWGPPRDRSEGRGGWAWGGVRAHWLRHVRSLGHAPAVNHEGLDAELEAGAALDAWAQTNDGGAA